MFGFGKKEQKRDEPAFEDGQDSVQVAQPTAGERRLADILGAEENDTNITAGVDAILDEETSLNDGPGEISGAEIDFSSLNQAAEAEIAAQNQQSMSDDAVATTDFNSEPVDLDAEQISFAAPEAIAEEKTEIETVQDAVADSEQVLELESEDIVEEPAVSESPLQEEVVAVEESSQNLDDNLDKLLEIPHEAPVEPVVPQSEEGAEVPVIEEVISEPKQETISQEPLPAADEVSSDDVDVSENTMELPDFLTHQEEEEVSQDYTVEDILDNKVVINQNEIVEANTIEDSHSDVFSAEEKESSSMIPEIQSDTDKPIYESIIDDIMGEGDSVDLGESDVVTEPIVTEDFTIEPTVEQESFREDIAPEVESPMETEAAIPSVMEHEPDLEPEPVLGAETDIVHDADMKTEPFFETESNTAQEISAEPEVVVSEPALEPEPEISSDAISEPEIAPASIPVVEDFVAESEIESKVEDVWVESPVVAEPIVAVSSEISADNDLWQTEAASTSLINPKILNRSAGLSAWEADDRQSDILVELESIGEASAWRIVLFNKTIMPLKNAGSDVSLEQKNGTIRYASLVQNGKEQLQMLNQSVYHFVAPQNQAVSVQGNSICTLIDESTQLNVDDFVVVSGVAAVQKTLRFAKPMSGFVSGPDGVLMFFAKVHSITMAVADYREDGYVVEYEPSLKGLDSRTDFVYDERQSEGEFTAQGAQRNLVVNVGSSLYGWNIRFDNEMFMSLRDALEYQSRYKKLPSANGEIIHGRKVFKFFGVEKLQAREKTVCYSYGNIR